MANQKGLRLNLFLAMLVASTGRHSAVVRRVNHCSSSTGWSHGRGRDQEEKNGAPHNGPVCPDVPKGASAVPSISRGQKKHKNEPLAALALALKTWIRENGGCRALEGVPGGVASGSGTRPPISGEVVCVFEGIHATIDALAGGDKNRASAIADRVSLQLERLQNRHTELNLQKTLLVPT